MGVSLWRVPDEQPDAFVLGRDPGTPGIRGLTGPTGAAPAAPPAPTPPAPAPAPQSPRPVIPVWHVDRHQACRAVIDSITDGWIDYSYNMVLVRLLSHALVANSEGHEDALLLHGHAVRWPRRARAAVSGGLPAPCAAPTGGADAGPAAGAARGVAIASLGRGPLAPEACAWTRPACGWRARCAGCR